MNTEVSHFPDWVHPSVSGTRCPLRAEGRTSDPLNEDWCAQRELSVIRVRSSKYLTWFLWMFVPLWYRWAHLSLSAHVFYENFKMLAYSRIRQQEIIICCRMLARPERWWKLNWLYTGRRWASPAVLEIFLHTVAIRVNVSVVYSSIGAGTPTDWLTWWGRLCGWRSLFSILDHPDLPLHHPLSRPHTEWRHQTGYGASDRENEVFMKALSGNWRLLAVTKRDLVKKKGLHWKTPSDCFAGMLQTPVVCTEDANFSSGCKKL